MDVLWFHELFLRQMGLQQYMRKRLTWQVWSQGEKLKELRKVITTVEHLRFNLMIRVNLNRFLMNSDFWVRSKGIRGFYVIALHLLLCYFNFSFWTFMSAGAAWLSPARGVNFMLQCSNGVTFDYRFLSMCCEERIISFFFS